MTSNDMPDQEIEQRLQGYFQAEAARLRAPTGLWARIRDRLSQLSDPGSVPAWQRIIAPRRWGLRHAFATSLVLLIAVTGAWLFTAAPWEESSSRSSWQGLSPDGDDRLPSTWSTAIPAPAPTTTPAPASAGFYAELTDPQDNFTLSAIDIVEGPPGLPGPASSPGALDITQRQVISQASLSIEVENVEAAVGRVRAVAESLGGFVGQLSSSGGPERQQSTMTIRVPQPEFFTALESIKALGKLRGENVGSEDVTEQFIDLKARLQSALREEESLLSLLERANTVSEILTIERELSRVRSEIERAQGQLNFLERRVELATITVSLFPPDVQIAEPPSASLTVEVSDVSGSVDRLRALVSTVGGEIDSVFLSAQKGKERADVILRVFSQDFDQVLSSVEAQGGVRSKEVREGKSSVNEEAAPSQRPDARIGVSFAEKQSRLMGRVIATGVPIGGAALVALLLYLSYRSGRRRTR